MYSPKVLVVTGFYPSAYNVSIGTFIHRRAKQLALFGCQVGVFTTVGSISCGTYLRSLRDVCHFYREPKRFAYEWDGITVQGVRFHYILPSQYSVNALRTGYITMKPLLVELIDKGEYNIVQIATGGASALAASRIAMEMSIPYLSTAYGGDIYMCYNKPYTKRYKVQLPILLNSQLAVCVSEQLNRNVKQMTDGRVETLTFYSGVDTVRFHKNADLRDEYRDRLLCTSRDVVLLFVGNLIRTKGIYELLHVIPRLRERFENVRLVMIGEEIEARRIRRTIKQLKIGSSVTLVGGVGHDKISGYMNASDMFVFPSWQEGLPNSVMEACACELPVIASNVGGIPELISDGENGILVPPRNEESLYRKITNLIESPELCSRLGKAARERVKRDFNYHKNGKILVERIAQILNNYSSTKKVKHGKNSEVCLLPG